MLERESPEKQNNCTGYGLKKHQAQNALEDLVLSISHRLSYVQNSLNSKIDRAQCMLIMESKANFNQIKKIAEDLNARYERDKQIAADQLAEKYEQNKRDIEKFKQKLRSKKKQSKKAVQQKNILTLKPQQLYLQSNQTMFSIIVDEISSIKQAQQIFQKHLEQRNKTTISLNNQVCGKIQHLERQIETSLKLIKDQKRESKLDQSRGYWSSSEQLDSRVKQASKTNFNKTQANNMNNHSLTNTEIYQISHIMRTIETLQKDLSAKINIKDIIGIIKKNIHPLNQSIEQIRKYTQEAIMSTKKILMNQSEINQQLCNVSKMGWWHSFEQRQGIAIWNKQIANLVPEMFVCSKDGSEILLTQQGTYIVKLLSLNNQLPETILVDQNEVEILGESLIKVEKNTTIQIPSSGSELFLTLLKL